MTNLRQILQKCRANAASERETGAYFEQLTKVWVGKRPDTEGAIFARSGLTDVAGDVSGIANEFDLIVPHDRT